MAESGASMMRDHRPHGRGWRARSVLGVVLVVALAPILATTAAAQQCDPVYGCSPTTSVPTTPPASCSLNAEVVTGGQIVTATVANAPAGAAIQVTIDGVPAGSGVADAAGSASITFTVPEGIAPGSHAVFAVGAGFSASCGELSVSGVGSEVVENTPPGGPSAVEGDDVGRGGGGGGLARTGIEVAALLAIALLLIVVGRHLVAAERRRRRRRARQHNAITDLAGQQSQSSQSL